MQVHKNFPLPGDLFMMGCSTLIYKDLFTSINFECAEKNEVVLILWVEREKSYDNIFTSLVIAHGVLGYILLDDKDRHVG